MTKDQLEAKLFTKEQAESTLVSATEPLPEALVDEVRQLADEAVLALACPAEMVAVGATCIDRVEASIWDAPCASPGAQRGAASDDYGAGFPDSGAFTTPLYACAKSGVTPSRFVTYFQAQQACALSGKRLCSDAEWQAAALGSPDGGCTTGGAAPKATGSAAPCASDAGALDMTGNLREIVADWQQLGTYWKNTNGEQTTDWPAGYGDGQDVARGINGTTAEPAKAGLPAMLLRGGSFGDGAAAGPYALSAEAAPVHSDARTGFRCCRSLR
jgi:formylglycine-generating enzyme required for sulfatase activity